MIATGYVEIEPGIFGHPGPNPKPGLYPIIEDLRAHGGPAKALTLDDVITDCWSAVENDLQDRGIDLSDPAVYNGRTWRWLAVRVEGLINTPPIGYHEVPDPADPKLGLLKPLWGTRVQQHVYAEEG